MDLKEKFQQAFSLHKEGRYQDAKKIYTEILYKTPDDFNCLHHLGLIARKNKEYVSAFELISKALITNPNSSEAHFNLGNVLIDLKRIHEAVKSYDLAIKIKPDYELYLVRGNALVDLKDLDTALVSYEESIALKPDCFLAFVNKGAVLVRLRDFDEAIASYDEAIKIKPTNILARYQKGLALKAMGNVEEAKKIFEVLIKTQPSDLSLELDFKFITQPSDLLSLYELALINRDSNNYNLALNYCDQILKTEPTHSSAILLSIKIRKSICDWSSYDKDLSYILERINDNEESIGPFSSITFLDDPALQKKSCEIHTSKYYPSNNVFKDILKYEGHKKIRIGYFSPDFGSHPVSNLIVELIEKHDKERFEIYAFSFVEWPNDEIKIRLKKAFKKFINVGNESTKDIVKLSRKMEIDIAIDLAGYTGKGRSEIFAMRTAPIQINYLGFASTSGANYFDYIIADSTVIPDNYQKHYNEKILYLDVIYPNDSKKIKVKNSFNREYFNLPGSCFIFACVNNNYKYNPIIFSSWMKILSNVSNSVLFLSANNELTKDNLRKEAVTRNIDPNRLIFSEKLNYSEYLERLNLMDLFLDTYPFNGHSTSCDALWAGLPILTLIGKTYGSRVTASLLKSVKLDSLVTHTTNDYENLAIDLANNPKKLLKLREKIINKSSLDLFNTNKFTKNLEDGYQKVYDRYYNNLLPDHIR